MDDAMLHGCIPVIIMVGGGGGEVPGDTGLDRVSQWQ